MSRFTVRRDYRPKRVVQDLVLTMMVAASRLQIDHAVAMMNPALPRLLRRLGIEFCQIGLAVDYHGTRAPYFTTRGYNESGLIPRLRKRYKEIALLLT
jgi:N-acyl amino acid synthase of PEP-CTERM/exosortase system